MADESVAMVLIRRKRERGMADDSDREEKKERIEKDADRMKEERGGVGEDLSSRSETNFIAEVVETVECKLNLRQQSTPAHLTGMEARVEVINLWLKNEQYNAIAICGMGGSGKTTVAQYIYNLNKKDFESSSFIPEIGKQADGLLVVQKQLLKDVSGGKKIRISNTYEGTHKMELVLQMKRVLIVLDDIDKNEQLSILLGTKALHTKSKILITTRLLDITPLFGSISWRCQVHKIKLLDDLESLELLSWYAFRTKTPMKGFKELAKQLAQYCGGNPLALKVLGSSLFVSDEDPWRRDTMKDIWRSRMNSLNSSKGDLDCNIQSVLRRSFDSLPLRSHKELSFHIACFFVGEDNFVIKLIMEDELYAKSGILTLIDRCLLTVSDAPTASRYGKKYMLVSESSDTQDHSGRTGLLPHTQSYFDQPQ
ncbi:disease resistance protein RUN1-like [Helianthus annuus]|uniref:disease resistance protein RUN1-like n=1 Tax=Helianthus annuus TaxID=4232 RepID=UPI000B900E24|nr:disease resistance protein RUN1-like [Helianthus annuus]